MFLNFINVMVILVKYTGYVKFSQGPPFHTRLKKPPFSHRSGPPIPSGPFPTDPGAEDPPSRLRIMPEIRRLRHISYHHQGMR